METTPELREHLVQSPYVQYARYGLAKAAVPAEGGAGNSTTTTTTTNGKWFAEYGARNLHIGGPIQVSEWVDEREREGVNQTPPSPCP